MTPERAIDLTVVPLHLGSGGTARVVDGFSWERIDEYAAATAADGPDGRLVMLYRMDGAWDGWECHPNGDEVVIACSGRHRFVQEIDGAEREIVLEPGQALINPAGVWHTADSGPGGLVLTITPGQGTEHRDPAHRRVQ